MGQGNLEKVTEGCFDFLELIWFYIRQVNHRGDLRP